MIRIERHPSRRQLAVFGLLWLIFFSILGGTAWWRTGSLATAGALGVIGAAVPAAGLVWPEVLRIVYLLTSYATFPVGLVISYAVLAVVYYLVITPIGLILRLTGYDPMQRRFDSRLPTYWMPREEEETTERYFRQF
ncbi:MAG: hypothetical protein JXB10_07195 [Pirellulales bacterium]|nr:hypothetical protein [Pirellulales bacterium]